MNTDDHPAPLFDLFWENSCLNTSRQFVLGDQIAVDSSTQYQPPRPRYAQASLPLPNNHVSNGRHSRRRFGERPLSIEDLSALFFPFSSRPDLTRELPSAGAKYPLLVYAHLLHTDHLYNQQSVWYDPVCHGLTPIGPIPPKEDLKTSLGIEDWDDLPHLVIMVCGHSEVITKKYGERGGRFLLLEAGAYMGSLYHTSSARELAGLALGSYLDSSCLKHLRLNPQATKLACVYVCGTQKSEALDTGDKQSN